VVLAKYGIGRNILHNMAALLEGSTDHIPPILLLTALLKIAKSGRAVCCGIDIVTGYVAVVASRIAALARTRRHARNGAVTGDSVGRHGPSHAAIIAARR
jgi:hypothetical protein